jgi:hypothetical protein
MPMPWSAISNCRAALSGTMRTLGASGNARAGLVRASNRRRSVASAALATSSRRNISRSE